MGQNKIDVQARWISYIGYVVLALIVIVATINAPTLGIAIVSAVVTYAIVYFVLLKNVEKRYFDRVEIRRSSISAILALAVFLIVNFVL